MEKNSTDIRFFDKLERLYFRMAFTELALDYYCLKEKEADFGKNEDSEDREFRNRIESLAGGCITDYDSLDGILPETEALRDGIKERVNLLVMKMDRLDLDDYISKRAGCEDELYAYKNDEEAAGDIVRAIFKDADSNVVNERIRNAVRELPVRMTKNRFFDILKDGLKKYIGAGKDILERIVFMLECSSGIAGDGIPYEFFGDRNMESLHREYESLSELAGICNYIFVIGKCDSKVRAEEKENVEKVLDLIGVSRNIEKEDESKIRSILTGLEGKLEELSEQILYYESKLSGYLESTKEADGKAFELEAMRRLLSSSVFADLDFLKEKDTGIVTEEDVIKEYGCLKDKLESAFDGDDRSLVRARMSGVLSGLPVFFNTRGEILDYIRNSLSSCRSAHEKNVAISMIYGSENDRRSDMED